ncbi:MAG TPA: type 1 glutamine amidotransferase domain-containing protein [Acidimicrobiales bacterium]|nr:type 1 glutamine amidotransferase domain-containing protein [Acidimicrobiales bacterium]
MAERLAGAEIAFLAANEGVEQDELTEPWAAVAAAGGRPVLVAPAPGELHTVHHRAPADTFDVDVTVAEADPGRFTGLVLPGGVANPDRLRMDDRAVAFTRSFFTAGAPVAAICHAPWMLIEADVVRDRELTSWPSLRTDLRNAGATWVDREVVVDTRGPNTLVTSRKPADLPAFCAALVEAFARARTAVR